MNHFCSAPLLVDIQNDTLLSQSSFSYLGHFSRFIKPGAKRVMCSASPQDLESPAVTNPDQSVATVVINRTEDGIPFWLRVDGQETTTQLLPHAIAIYL